MLPIVLALGLNPKLCGVSASSTNYGFTVIAGAIYLSPGSAITGFPPGVATTTKVSSSIAIASQTKALTTFNTYKGLTSEIILSVASLLAKASTSLPLQLV